MDMLGVMIQIAVAGVFTLAFCWLGDRIEAWWKGR